MRRSRVLTIPPGVAFLDILADALLDGDLVEGYAPRGDPAALAAATLYLPTRRAVRAFREVLLDRAGGEAVLLPRILALGEVDEDEAAFEIDEADAPLPPAAAGIERQIGLTRLILRWSQSVRGALLPIDGEDEPLMIPSSPGDAAALATSLAGFIDGLQIDRVPAAAIGRLEAEHQGRYSSYWDLTARFLAIATALWPEHLSEIGRLDPVERRNRLIAAETARIAAGRRPDPVIVAGSTGSVPATRDLIAAVAGSARGAVVLPGLDLRLDEAGWRAVATSPGHPQAGLAALVEALGLERDDIAEIGRAVPERADRAHLVSEALRPAATTDLWTSGERLPAGRVAAALDGFAIVEAANEAEEALAAALALREALDHPTRCVALVTPDRGLAGRVVAELGRWGILADDSAGRPLSATPPGVLARLVLDAALAEFGPVETLALLKHPLVTLGLDRAGLRRAAETLEIGALRGPRPPRGSAGLRRAIAAGRAAAQGPHASALLRAIGEAEWLAAEGLVDRLEAALSPFAAALSRREAGPAAALFAAHVAAVEAAAGAPGPLYAQEAGLELDAFFADLLSVPEAALDIAPVEYPGLYASLSAGRSVRGGEPRHPRLAIYGLLEARLLGLDRVVLGGLDEGIWPGEARLDPWLNRPMRAALGLSPPEKRIGLAAHDFEQALGIAEVVVTRAVKRGGAPTVPSRWLQRLDAYLGEDRLALRRRGAAWLTLARRLDAPAGRVAVPAAPRPRPPLALRPSRLSVTQIETLVRDPYAIYARHVLRLERLDPIAAAPGAGDRGTLIHAAIEAYAALWRDGPPADGRERLVEIGRGLFAELMDYPDVVAFWWPRFLRVAAFLVAFEARRRPGLAAVATERGGSLAWETPAGRRFTLTAKADRIETDRAGRATILDFKTGAAPTARQIETGLAPQLALEGAMLLAGGFREAPSSLADLVVVGLGATSGGFDDRPLAFDSGSAEDVSRRALARLEGLIARFEDEATPYASLLHPMFKGRRFSDYDHLARVREWSLASDEGGGE